MRPKLLIDENLSPAIVSALCADGIDACHVRDRDMLGCSDAEILDRAFIEDRTVVTSNGGDFVQLACARDIHAGLVVLVDGALHRQEQLAVIRAAIRRIDEQDMMNRVLRIAIDGTMTFEDVSA